MALHPHSSLVDEGDEIAGRAEPMDKNALIAAALAALLLGLGVTVGAGLDDAGSPAGSPGRTATSGSW